MIYNEAYYLILGVIIIFIIGVAIEMWRDFKKWLDLKLPDKDKP